MNKFEVVAFSRAAISSMRMVHLHWITDE